MIAITITDAPHAVMERAGEKIIKPLASNGDAARLFGEHNPESFLRVEGKWFVHVRSEGEVVKIKGPFESLQDALTEVRADQNRKDTPNAHS